MQAYDAIEAQIRCGRTVTELAPLYGLGRLTLRWRLKQMGRPVVPPRTDPLSRQRRQVWDLTQQGVDNAAIAERLGISERGVSAALHKARLTLGFVR
jgi:DNA-binding NarL/FixJ family response regulator